tara:strand:+ start:9192 stop:9722 length:531 start_codon:yes stop_codon:yes gene_type:complete
MIESCYWKEDLLAFAKHLEPVRKPPRYSEKLQVNFEKQVIVHLFMIRKLMESYKLSSKSFNYRAQIFRSPCVKRVTLRNFWCIDEVYDFEQEEKISKDIKFICNQFIHGGATFAYRGEDRNWHGLYTCSDFEKQKYVYRITVDEIRKIFELVGTDYPSTMKWTYCDEKEDYVVETD